MPSCLSMTFYGKMSLEIRKAKASKPREGFIPNPRLKLLDQVSEVMRFKHYSLRTEVISINKCLTESKSSLAGSGGKLPRKWRNTRHLQARFSSHSGTDLYHHDMLPKRGRVWVASQNSRIALSACPTPAGYRPINGSPSSTGRF